MDKILQIIFPQHRFTDDFARRSYLAVAAMVGAMFLTLLLLPLGLMFYVRFQNPIWLIALSIMVLVSLFCFWLVRKGFLSLGVILLLFTNGTVTIIPSILEVNSLSYAGFFLAQNILLASITLKPRYIWLVYFGNLLLLAGGAWHVLEHGPSSLDYPILNQLLIRAVTFNTVVLIFTFLAAIGASNFVRRIEQNRQAINEQSQLLAQQKHDLEERIELRTNELQQALDQLEQQAYEQEQLLSEKQRQENSIRTLRIPIIPLNEQTLIMPLVGELELDRMRMFHDQALTALQNRRSRYLIIDISGVPYVDHTVARGFIEIVKSARLIGSDVVLVGIRPEVAHILTQLRISLSNIQSYANLQAALENLRQTGKRQAVLAPPKVVSSS
jgi:rsbT co-antagonist protein RsbR